jgi:hypothetical protein
VALVVVGAIMVWAFVRLKRSAKVSEQRL